MVTFLNIVYVTTGVLALIMVAGLFCLTALLIYADWRYGDADADAERGDQRIVRGAVANSMGKP